MKHIATIALILLALGIIGCDKTIHEACKPTADPNKSVAIASARP